MAFITVTTTFVNDTTIDAGEVNTNYQDIIDGTSDATKDFSIAALTAAGAATLNGHVTLGNGSGDDLTINASLASSIPIKTDASYDIGTSSVGLGTVYFGGNSKRVGITGSGSMTATWTLTLPITAGSADEFLQTNGSGVAAWTSVKTTYEVKYLTGDESGNNVMTDLSYTLTAERTYRITLITRWHLESAAVTANIVIKDDTDTITTQFADGDTGADGTQQAVSFVYEMVGTALTFTTVGVDLNESVLGNSSRNETHVIVEQLPFHEAGTVT